MDEFLSVLNSDLCGLMLHQKATNLIFKSFIELVKKIEQVNSHLIADDNGMSPEQALNMSTNFICNKLSKYSTDFKRCKQYEASDSYVSPQQLSLGVRWESKKSDAVSIPSLIQCKYQYVSICKTIKSLFQRADFRDVYLNYNQSNEIKAVSGVYTDFSSGSVFKTNELFKSRPNSLQIQIATDDFEVCNAIGSKATLHKINGIYLSIMNMPPQFRSKLINIPLVALCNSDDLQTKFTDFNDIWHIVVKDLSHLEDGISVGDGLNIAGTLVDLTADNLGANAALGFPENFSKTSFFCRYCESSKDECLALNENVPSKRRTKERYMSQIATIANSAKIDLKETHGVKRYCELNNLKYFHMLDNMAPDIMHDLNEGAIQYLMKHLFDFCTSEKILSEGTLKNKIQYHNDGSTNEKNRLSVVSLDKRNLNQNASQMLCLFQHIPFILHSYRNNRKLKQVWICVESLLRITQIAYSSRIDEDDLSELEENTRIHIDGIQEHFKAGIIPKLHFITHYSAIIRLMGPLVAMSMKRFESKHKTLKEFATNTNNFVNLTKTLAIKHQQMMSMSDGNYTDNFISGKLKKVSDVFQSNHADLMREYFDLDKDIYETKSLEYNMFKYREGLFISENNFIFEIQKIIVCDSEYYFVCAQFEFVAIDSFLNSIKIEKRQPSIYAVIKFNSLSNKNVFEKQILNEEYYIVLKTMDLKNIYQQ